MENEVAFHPGKVEPSIESEEVPEVRKLKSKSPGTGDISVELLKAGGDPVTDLLQKMCNCARNWTQQNHQPDKPTK